MTFHDWDSCFVDIDWWQRTWPVLKTSQPTKGHNQSNLRSATSSMAWHTSRKRTRWTSLNVHRYMSLPSSLTDDDQFDIHPFARPCCWYSNTYKSLQGPSHSTDRRTSPTLHCQWNWCYSSDVQRFRSKKFSDQNRMSRAADRWVRRWKPHRIQALDRYCRTISMIWSRWSKTDWYNSLWHCWIFHRKEKKSHRFIPPLLDIPRVTCGLERLTRSKVEKDAWGDIALDRLRLTDISSNLVIVGDFPTEARLQLLVVGKAQTGRRDRLTLEFKSRLTIVDCFHRLVQRDEQILPDVRGAREGKVEFRWPRTS